MALEAITQSLQVLGPYRILQVLGFNGVFATFKAMDPNTELPVAIVAVHASNIMSPDILRNFSGEVSPFVNAPASRLVRPMQYGEDGGHYWCAYEWLMGSHLGVQVRDKGLPDPALAFQWMAELCEAVGTLHEKGVAHRIISPASIFINQLTQVKLLHAAWGRVMLGTKGGIIKPQFASILPFLPPEIAQRQESSEPADVYAIGANLYFLLTGQPPFWHDDPKSLADMIAKGRPDFSILQQMGLPQHGIDMLDEMMAPDPADRPVNMPALAERLMGMSTEIVEMMRAAEEQQADPNAAYVIQQEEPAPAAAPPPRGASRTSAPSNAVPEAGPPPYIPPRVDIPPAPVPAATKEPASHKRSNMLVIVGGVVFLLVIVLGGVLAMKLMGKKSEEAPAEVAANGGGEEEPDAPEPAKTPAPGKAAGGDAVAKYDATVTKLNAAGAFTKGYFKQNGIWPKKTDQLLEVGAKKTDLVDAWNRPLDVREDGNEPFVISAGADGQWDNDDDVWLDVKAGKIDGFLPKK